MQLTTNGVRVSRVAVKPRMKRRYALKAGRPSANIVSIVFFGIVMATVAMSFPGSQTST